MKKIAVVFWSGTGNTEQMANYVALGAKDADISVETFSPTEFSADNVDGFDAIAFGCPSMGAEVLEEDEFNPMWESVAHKLKNKKIALFGSYGWGDGEWMRDWEENAKDNGANLVTNSVICNESPDDEAIEGCMALGKSLSL